MKKLYFISLLVASIFFTTLNIRAQQQNDTASYPYWIEMMQDYSINFYKTQRAFNLYWQNRKHQKSDGWKVFKRWEYFWEGRIDEKGNFPPADEALNAYKSLANQGSQPLGSSGGSWTQLGPVSLPVNGTGQPNGLGRVNAITFNPTNTSVIWVGAPSGGLWKSSNGGNTWTAMTDNMPTLGVSDILIDSSNTSIMYLGTGDRDAGDARGKGVWKSTNGGASWFISNTGMWNKTVGKMIMNPTNHNIILAATSGGIYRTTNAGANWSLVSTASNFKDIKFKPGNPNIVYAATGKDFYRSTDGGVNFSQITNGLPTTGNRLVIGVSPANPNYVYALVGGTSGLVGCYLSTNSGQSFVTKSTSPNILGYSANGSDNSSQSWYDLAIAVDPSNASIIYVGGVNIWKSTNGGSTWSIVAHWTGSSSTPAVHADQHVFTFKPGTSQLYIGCDGGIYYTTNGGTSWTDISSGLGIAQIYKLGQSHTNVNRVITGMQDNGTNIYLGNNSWSTEIGGDGMNCIIDPTTTNYMYGALYYGDIRRSTNGGISFSTIAKNGVNGINESGAWVTPYTLQSKNPNTMFVGYKNVWRSSNVKSSGVSWTKISNFSNSYNLRVIENSMADTNVLYTGRNTTLYRSDNACTASPTWTTMTVSGVLHDIETHPTNPNIVYIAASKNVFKSTNKGGSYTSITNNLPNVNVNCIVFDTTKTEALYVGTDVGVFYWESGMSGWVNFSSGLPASAEITDLEIFYGSGNSSKIRASSYGRGLWSSDLYSPPNAPPIADFGASTFNVCTGGTTQLVDSSTNNPSSWQWTITPSTISFVGGTSAASQNPIVKFNATGNYTVKLVVSNSYGSDSVVKTNFISVGTPYTAPFMENFETFTPGNPGTWMHGWTFSNTGVFNWRANSGGTPSQYTGPLVDHTYGTNTGKYLYTEASNPAVQGEVANLISPCISIPSSGANVLQFWYHMYGATIDGLHVDIFYNGAWVNDIYTINGQQQTSNASSWQSASVSLASYLGATVKFRFRVIRGSNYMGDVAVDDIFVGVTGMPVANFTSASTTTCAGGAIKFVDISSNSPNSWKWSVSPSTYSFVNNTDSASQNPYIKFNATGTYTVQLIATNSIGSDTMVKNNYITVNAANSLPFTENFESFTVGTPGSLANGWISSSSGNFPWTVNSGATPSANTGPQVDHTFGTNAGKYMFTEASNPAQQGNVAELISPCIDLTNITTPVNLSFWYHMYGSNITGLHVDIFYNGNWINDVHTINGQQQSSNAAPWAQQIVNISAYTGASVKLRFRVIRGSNYMGDVAIDDISVAQVIPPVNDDPCNAISLTVDSVCNYLTTNNNNATVTTGVPAPGCGGTIYQDVWFKAVVPVSGNLVAQGAQVPGNFSDGAMAAYSGSCNNLALLACNDDFGGNGTMPHLDLTGLTPGDTVYFRFWKYAGGYGSFKICVYEPPYFILSPATISVGSGAGSSTVNVLARASTSWSVSDNASWLTVSPTSGSGNGTLTLNYSANASGSRTAIITGVSTGLPNQTVVLTQQSNVVADFTLPGPYLCSGSSVTFTNTSINANSYKWYLNGNLVSTQTNYTHTFNTIGTYTLKLVAEGTLVNDSVSKFVFVANVPVADAGSDTSVCENASVTLNPAISIGIVSCNSGCGMPTTCPSASNNDTQEYIIKVKLNASENPSGNQGQGYQDFTQNVFTRLLRDSTYILQVTGFTGGNWKEYVDAFIDWNRNGLFDEPAISMGYATFNGTHIYNGIVTVPSNVVLGKTKMRIIMRYNTAIQSGCQNAYSYGETEDYMIEVMAIDTLDYSWTGPASFSSIQVNPSINPVLLSNNGYYNLTVTNGFGCSAIDSVNLTVNAAPNASFTSVPDACISTPAFTLTQGSPTGGSYSGTGVSGNTFNPSVAGVGTHWITYSVTNAGGCSDTAMQSITVHANPVVSFSGLPASMCQTDAAVSLIGTPSGGTFTGTGIVSGNQFDPVTAGAGIHAITYSYTDANQCSDSASQSVTVHANPVAFAGNDTSINYGTTAQLTASASPSATYTYAWSPSSMVTNSNSASTSTVALTASQQFSVLVTNSTTTCSDSDQVMVNVTGGPLSLVVTANLDTICQGDSTQVLATASGGAGNYSYSWSSTPSGFTSTLMNPTVYPAYTTTYIVTVTSGSSSLTDSVTVFVNSLPNVSLSPFADMCANEDTLALSGGFPLGGVYSGYGVSNGIFDPAVAGTGTHTITYTYTNSSGCTATATQNLTVNALPNVTLANIPPVCGSSAPVSLTQGSPYGGTYSGVGVTGNIFNPSVAGVGVHNIVYVFTDANQCTNSDTNTITVASSPVANAGVDQQINSGGSATLVGSATGGSGSYAYSWSPAALLTSPNTATTNTVSLTASNIFTLHVNDTQTSCSDSDQVIVTVTGGPLSASINMADLAICYGDSTTLTALGSGGTGNYSYQWSSSPAGFSSTAQSPVVSPTVNTVYILTLTDGVDTVTANTPFLVVDALPVATMPEDTSLCQLSSITLDAGGGYAQYQWSDGSTTQTTQAVGPNLPLGITMYYVTITNTLGCSIDDSIAVDVQPIPQIDLGPDTAICIFDSVVLDAGSGYSAYLWNTGDTTQTIVFYAKQIPLGDSVIFSVKVWNGPDCFGTDSIQIKSEVCESIDESESAYQVNIFPNPSRDYINVEIKGLPAEELDIRLYNMQGMLIYHRDIDHYHNDAIKIKVQHLPGGVYNLQLRSKDLYTVKKVIVQ